MTVSEASTGAVVIGRNEGDRLRRCLQSLVGRANPIVYVDSASSDDSVTFSRSLGAEVVELDTGVPFSAARARNEGFARLRSIAPSVEWVQFVDGDCEVLPGWIERAAETLAERPEVVAVTGVRRERYPDRSLLNAVCDVEWRQGPFGVTDRFGGDVMIRAQALADVGGYNPRVIAAEDDEVAARLVLNGGTIIRLDVPMTLHDAAMYRVSQWWQRAKRCGHGYAQVGALHGGTRLSKFERERKRTMMWGMAIPAAAVVLAPPTLGATLLIGMAYPARALHIAFRATRDEGMSPREGAAWGLSCAFSSVPEAVGMAKYYVDRALQRAPQIIEYKGPK